MSAKKIIVIGGGPAGIMAAIRAGELGADVTLLERNASLGRKLLLTGNGRCNLTNTCALDKFLERFFTGGQFLRDAFKALSNRDLIRFFEKEKLEFKVEEGGRVIPVTDRASSVLDILEKKLKEANVKVLFGKHTEDIVVRDGKVVGAALGDGTEIIECDSIILATGGLSYPSTGSDGDGYRMAKELGHKVLAQRAGLVAMNSANPIVRDMEGLSFKGVRLTFTDGKKKLVSNEGDILFTSTGISGPLVISMSGKVVDWLNEGKKVKVLIDVNPTSSPDALDAALRKILFDNPAKNIRNILKEQFPERFVDAILETGGVDPAKKANQVTHKERTTILLALKSFALDISGARAIEEAMVTRGGVSLKEVDPRTMASRLVKGLYFAGEMLDIDGDTGGFNLQAAFSTGWLAGGSAAQVTRDEGRGTRDERGTKDEG